jgi:uncharacterized membrane protein YecN with MAPEG domain
MILPMTLTMAAASTLLNVWLGIRVGQMRQAHKVSIGDGGALPLIARMRAQANFVEYTPFFLILLGGVEMARGQPLWLWVIAALFVVARILHAFGMDRAPGNRLRMIGSVSTGFILIALCVYAIVIVYMDRMERMRPTSHETFVAAAQAPAST